MGREKFQRVVTVIIQSVCRHLRRMGARKRKRLLGTAAAALIIIALIITTAVIAGDDLYDDERDFVKYADDMFRENDDFRQEGKTEKKYGYGEKVSYAVELGTTDDKGAESFRQKKVKELIGDYRAARKGDEGMSAIIISTETFDSGNGITSLIIRYTDNREGEKEMEEKASHMDTWLISQKNHVPVHNEQVLTADYRDACSEFFTSYFSEEYDKEELAEGWKDSVSASPVNFNSFVVSENNVTFCFDAGEVLKEEAGAIAVKASKMDMPGIFRDEVRDRYIDPEKPMVALTYDDGPAGASETRILDCLEKHDAKATFFYCGNRLKHNGGQLLRAKSLGCEIGNHTWSHPVLTDLPLSEAKKELSRTSEAIYRTCGSYPTVFRPSYGATDEKINKASGMPVILWSIDTLDWKSRDAGKVYAKVRVHDDLDGTIILMHSIYDSTAAATEKIVKKLDREGYQMVTVSELIRYREAEEAVKGKVYN